MVTRHFPFTPLLKRSNRQRFNHNQMLFQGQEKPLVCLNQDIDSNHLLLDTVSKMCRLEFRFQNIPFSKSAGKNVLFSCERPIRRIFHRFQNVPASCERSLRCEYLIGKVTQGFRPRN